MGKLQNDRHKGGRCSDRQGELPVGMPGGMQRIAEIPPT
jgi:hypothetical protein